MNKADFDVKMKYLENTQPKFVGLVFPVLGSKKLHIDIYEDDDYKFISRWNDLHVIVDLYAIVDGSTLEEVCQEFRWTRSKYMKRQMNNEMKEVK